MPSDAGLATIAKALGQEEAVAVFRDAAAAEEAGDCPSAAQLYRRSFRMWAALDSALDENGLPRGVRRAAEDAGIDCDGLSEESLETQASPRFHVAATEQWLEHLDEHGYCVLEGVADAAAVARAKSLLWDFLEGAPESQVKRDDASSWGDWLPSSANGILGSLGFGQSAFCWHARLLPAVKRVFATVWRCDDLLVSFDGGNVFRPWSRRPEWRTEGSWWHVDQNCFLPGRVGRACVQGLVTFTDATPVTGGLCVVPGSHREHADVCERSCARRLAGDFVQVQPGDPVFERRGRLVRARAGDLVLWDSRCVHCNTPGVGEAESAGGTDDELLRVAAYVCMTPAAWAAQDVLTKRKDAFLGNVTLNHLPHEVQGDCQPSPWPIRKKWSDATEEQRCLIRGRI